jgi:hypothetical protein
MLAILGFLCLVVLGIFRAADVHWPGGDVAWWAIVAGVGLAWAVGMRARIRELVRRLDQAASADRRPGDQHRWR